MTIRTRIMTTIAVAFLLAPTLLLHADDTAKPTATAKAANTKPTVAMSASLPGNAEPQSTDVDNDTPRLELFQGFSTFWGVPMSGAGNRIAWLSGGTTSLAINTNRYFGIVADIGVYHASRFGPGAPPVGRTVDANGQVYTYMFGPRLSLRRGRFTPFAQALFGAVHASEVTLSGCSGIGCTPLPSENSFAMAAGGGLDLTLTRHFALRLVQAEYAMTRFKDPTSSAGQSTRQNDVRLSVGIVFRFGRTHRPPPPADIHP